MTVEEFLEERLADAGFAGIPCGCWNCVSVYTNRTNWVRWYPS